MFNRYNEAERKCWLQTKAQGRNRFIWREVLGNILMWLVIVPVVAFGDRPHSFSERSTAFFGLIMLPIFIFGGYLSGRWKLKDFERKYPRIVSPPEISRR